jgi:hypothetical protein
MKDFIFGFIISAVVISSGLVVLFGIIGGACFLYTQIGWVSALVLSILMGIMCYLKGRME